MPIDPVSLSMAKKAMKSVIFSDYPPDIHKLWYDTKTGILKGYNLKKQKWGYISDLPTYANFDNDGGGYWTGFISLDITTPPSFPIQYCIIIEGNKFRVVSNDLSKYLVDCNIGTGFWNTVAGINDIRVFDDNFRQNYFWIEEFDIRKKVIKIWVKLNAGQRKIGIAFGNEKALKSKYNNGNMVFEFFDHFDESKLDTNKWVLYRGHPVLKNSCITNPYDFVYVRSKNPLNLPIIVTAKIYGSGTGYADDCGIGLSPNKPSWDYAVCRYISLEYQGDWGPNVLGHLNMNMYLRVKVPSDKLYTIFNLSNEVRWWLSTGNRTVRANVNNYRYITLALIRTTSTQAIDFVYARKYIKKDLSFGQPEVNFE